MPGPPRPFGQPGDTRKARQQGGRKGPNGQPGRHQGSRKGPIGRTREAPGRQERTNWIACKAPGRQERTHWTAWEAPGKQERTNWDSLGGTREAPGGRKGGGTREAGKDHLDSLAVKGNPALRELCCRVESLRREAEKDHLEAPGMQKRTNWTTREAEKD